VQIPKNKRGDGQHFFQELANSPWPGMWNPYNGNSETFGPMGLGRYRPRSVQQWVQLYCNTSAEEDLRSTAGITGDKLRAISAPVLAVYGDRSGFLPTMRRLSSMLPNCHTRLVPGVGHLLPVVAPGVFVQAVRAFLGDLGNGRRARAGAS
jgi:pimeloyl-ACP methyl ester carboxylesterase